MVATMRVVTVTISSRIVSGSRVGCLERGLKWKTRQDLKRLWILTKSGQPQKQLVPDLPLWDIAI